MSKYLDVSGVAARLGISKPTAYRWVKNLPSVKNGRGRTFNQDDIDQLRDPSKLRKAGPTEQPDFAEIGSSSIRRSGSTIEEERLRQLRGREGAILFREMRLNDPVIAAVFLAIENSLRRVSMRVKPASENIVDLDAASFVDQCLNDMSFSWSDELQFILGFLEQGHSILETVMKRRLGPNPPSYIKDAAPSLYNDNRIGWRKWAPRPTESLTSGQEWMFDENGGIKGIRQSIPEKYGEVREIPIERLLLFRTTVAPSNSPTGVPIHRAAYTAWWKSQGIEEIEGIGIERDLAGLPVIYMGADTRKAGSNSDFEQAKEIVVNLRADEQAGVVFPYPKLGTAGDNRGMLLELLSTSGRRAYDTSKILQRLDQRKAMSMLAMFITLGMEAVGSFALGRLQADIFALAVSAWAENIAETINRYAIPRLFRYNVFSGLTQYPKMVPTDVGIPNLEEIAIYVNTLVGAGLLKPGAELERHLRQIAHLPQRDEFATDEQSTDESPASNDRGVLRAARAALILNRLRLLQRDGLLTPEQAQQMMGAARDELISALGSDVSGGELPLPKEPLPAEPAQKDEDEEDQ